MRDGLWTRSLSCARALWWRIAARPLLALGFAALLLVVVMTFANWTWLNENNGAVVAIATCILVAVTCWYAVLTFRMVRTTERLREDTQRAEVVVRVAFHQWHFQIIDLIIENVGASAAFDVSLDAVGESVFDKGVGDLSEYGPFKHGIRVLAAGERLKTFLTTTINAMDQLLQIDSVVHVRWRSAQGVGRERHRAYPISFKQFEGTSSIGAHPALEAAEELEKMRKILQRVERGSSKLKVISYTPDEIDRGNRVSRLSYRLRRLPADEYDRLESEVLMRTEELKRRCPGEPQSAVSEEE